ncbi:F-box/LRR-repeat protein 15-like isoform X2 [Durio zibethinus]|uniref:F-box/LRR-repeat protein 15-like isoform X2 n=1 Tax=Durio zibethinus TaxID=66656 RepID=A0A6P5XWG9_DURZI|nr:F-box/LRR-repeat protein 15-like isoform X2 [Durio zibethinus]
MRIWCCLCFIDDEEDDNQREGTMKEVFLANVDDFEGNIVNDDDDDHEEEEEEEAPTTVTVAPARFSSTLARTLNSQRPGDQTLLLFEEMVTAMRGGGNWDDAMWHPSMGCSRPSEGETSASASTAVQDCDHHDWHHKRAKVYSGFREGTSCSFSGRDFNINQGSSNSSNNGVFYHNFMLNNGSDGRPFDGNGGKDDEDEAGLRAEDFEVRMDLTDDLLHMVFSFLDHGNLCHAAMVCRQWRAASAHEDFWRCLNFENRNVSLEQFEDMCQRYPNATEVNLSGTPNIHLLVMKAVSSLRNLEALTLGKGQLGDAFFHALAECSMLRSLDVNDAILGNAVQEISINHDRLCDLKVTKCRVMRISIRCPQLKSLSLKRSNMAQAALNCPVLHLLDISACHKLTDAAIRSAELELDSCHMLTSVSLDLPHLQKIRLVHCRKFADLNVQCFKLSSITVSNCAALHRINISSNSLQKLVLQKQENLTTLALQCQCLQEVDLTDCASLTNSICTVFSDGGGCPMLKSLVLDNCESLTAVQFSSTSLVSLSLVGCRAITTLDLACPCLEKICLDGCDHLERASFYPAALRSLNLGICPKLNTLRIDAPYMVSLELKGCGVLSEASINCPLLMSLDASFCCQLKDDCLSATTASCSLIVSLILMSCPSIGSDGLYALRWLPNLTTLDLSYTFLTNLQPVFMSCLQLKVLKLQACKYLADSSLEPLYKEGALRELRDLDLSYGTLCQSAIEELLAYCTHLTHLSLNGCINMHDLNWGANGGQFESLSVHNDSSMFCFENINEPVEQANRLLQNLNCVGCPSIRKVLIPPAARCFHLSSLNLSLSANLKEVDLACFNLSFLNLSNCCSLEVLKLGCPKLTSLFLQSCNIMEEAVETAISQCSMLETLDVRFCPKICSISMGRLRAVCPSLKRIFSSLSPA